MADGLSQGIDAFLRHAAVERGLSPRTLEAYGRDLARFAGFLEERGIAEPAAIGQRDVLRYLEALADDGLAPRSRARMFVAVRRWLRHELASGRIAGDPTEGLSAPRIGQALPKVLRTDESEALIAAAAGDDPLLVREPRHARAALRLGSAG